MSAVVLIIPIVMAFLHLGYHGQSVKDVLRCVPKQPFGHLIVYK
jgi:hypothetical protein